MSDLLAGAAGTRFDKMNWPTPEIEVWRRTDLARLLPKGLLDLSAKVPAVTLADIEERHAPLLPANYAARVITERGLPVAMAVSEQAVKAGLSVEWVGPDELPPELEVAGRAELDEADERVTAWHWRDMPGSLIIHLPSGVVLDEPVVIEERLIAADETSPLFTAPHIHIKAEESTSLNVVWSFEGAPDVREKVTPIVNAGLTANAGPNARVDITLRQNLGERVVFFLHDRLNVDRDARIDFRESHLGGSLVKTRARVMLSGEGSDARLKGLFIAGEGRHMDIGTMQEHRSPRATSDAVYKGVVRSGGRSIFQGLIEVSPKAAKTDAYLTNKNLVLGDGARADSVPQLNILTDDVKCSHGSTTGKLDEAQLFYLKSRGFSQKEAERELTRGFLAEVIDGAPEAVAEILASDLDSALAE